LIFRLPHPRQRLRPFGPQHALEGPQACEFGALSRPVLIALHSERPDYNMNSSQFCGKPLQCAVEKMEDAATSTCLDIGHYHRLPFIGLSEGFAG
jgi:hypothetical protein